MCPPWVQWSRLRACHRQNCRSKTCYVVCHTLEVSVAVGGQMDLDLRKVRYFVAVAEELNFGRAAERLHIAQPVLSRQIRALEKELHAQLFVRDSSGTQLTRAGTQLLADASLLLAGADAARRHVAQAARGTSAFTVGFMPGLTVTEPVLALSAAHPALLVGVLRPTYPNQAPVFPEGRADTGYTGMPAD